MDKLRLVNVFNFLIIVALMVAISYFLVKKNLLPHYINKISTFITQQTDKNVSILQQRISSLKKELKALQEENELLKAKLNSLEKNRSKQKQQIDKKLLKDHLLKHLPQYEELFPGKKPNSGILGGKWIFYDLDIISDNKVRAYYEDGHINGRINLHFVIGDKGKVKWELAER